MFHEKTIIGLTGGIGTGKSNAGRMFKRLGAAFIDTDRIARSLLTRRTPERKKIAKMFGKRIVGRGGRIDRKALAGIVFGTRREDIKNRRKLERVLHPAIWRAAKIRAAAFSKRMVVVEVPLLFEAKWEKKFDLIVTVYCGRREQLSRIPPDFRRRIVHQMPLSKKIKLSDVAIDSSGTKAATFKQVKRIFHKVNKSKHAR